MHAPERSAKVYVPRRPDIDPTPKRQILSPESAVQKSTPIFNFFSMVFTPREVSDRA